MKILKTLLFVVIALVLVLVAVGAVLPDTTHVERSVVIDAPPDHVFTFANNIKNFNQWSPWHPIDPNTKYSFSGPDQGVGAKMTWQSDHKNVGSGSQEIMQSQANELVKVFLDFGDMGVADAIYALKPEGEGTHFTWAFDTEHGWNLMGRYFGLMMDSWVGTDYEKGLAKLKQVVETDYNKQ
ncbi:MAG: SRPBCC family protein [Pseudomonadales bacterium]